jgi:cellobiose phosphorylase
MDMAPENGESVAFSALYASNLFQLSNLVNSLKELGIDQVELADEVLLLIDSISSQINYDSVAEKLNRLNDYYVSCRHATSGNTTPIKLDNLAKDLENKSNWLKKHIRKNEWIQNKHGYSWFNGYYDNDGRRVEGVFPKGVRMTLTGQVFTLMGNIANDQQSREMVKASDQYLWDPAVGGYRLNSDFGEIKLNLGRAFGFAYGHKENGAMFSHMAVMYANALYQRGLIPEGYKILDGIYRHCQDFQVSRMYPGIPEYIDPNGRGMYTWLTGSASWYLMTLITQVFGVGGLLGDLMINPKLSQGQFDNNDAASITTLFAGKLINLSYKNPGKLDFGDYKVKSITVDGLDMSDKIVDGYALIPRAHLENMPGASVEIIVGLGEKT